MTLSAPNLDDRRFQDLVDDAKRFIQQRCPQWSDHNVSDPGVTLIETFAMVTDQLLYRLNRVPDRLYLRFLELLGIDVVPPVAARADVTFWLTAPREDTITVRARTEVATERTEPDTTGAPGTAVVAFETAEDLAMLPCSLTTIVTAAARERPVDRTNQLKERRPVACFAERPAAGDAILFGLSNAVPRCAVAIEVDCQAEGAGVDPRYPPWRWEASTARGWVECELEPGRDGTGGFNQPGAVVMHVPADHVVSDEPGLRAAWLRCTLIDRKPFYELSPHLYSASAYTVGGTIPAVHAETVHDELIGLSEGVPGQRFRLGRGPVLGGAAEPLVVEVASTEPGRDGWQAWERVDHFDASTPTDRHFRLDAATGEIVFGPGVRQLDSTVRQYGAVPDLGAPIRAAVYRVGGGRRGNVAAGSITTLRTSVPFVDTRVGNRRPATGGVEGEDIEAVKRRAPAFLRTRQRAVTTADYEYLATASDPRAARTRCLAGQGAEHAAIRLAVVPVITGDPERPASWESFQPDEQLLDHVAEDLDGRRVLGTRLSVEAPFYQRVTAEARCTAAPRADADRVRSDALAALYRYLHPLVGGPDGTGWPFGRTVVAGELLALLGRVPGVAQVDEVRLYRFDARTGARSEGWTTRIELGAGALPFSEGHTVVVT